MSGSCTVTPGAVVAVDTSIDGALLNLIGKPVVVVDPQSIGADELIKSEVVDLLGSGASGYNYLDNPNFAENRWSRGGTVVSCPLSTPTFRADEWWCLPSGAATTYERVVGGPDFRSLHAAKLTGATSATTVDFGQDLPRRIATALATKLLLSFWIHNDTGAALTPTVRVNTCDSADAFGSVTNRISQAMSTAAANGAWQFYEVALNCTGLTNIANGMQIVLRLPSGALSSGAKSVTLGQCKLETTDSTTASPFVVVREEAETDATAAGGPVNLLDNGMLDRWLTGVGFSIPCSAGVDTYAAADFFVNAAGASTADATLSAAAPANNLTAQSLRVTGGAGVNAVKIGQRLEVPEAGKLRRNVTFSVWVKYHDGAAGSTSPTLVLATPSAQHDWRTASEQVQLSQDLDPCADDVWTKLSYQFDATAFTDLDNGLKLYLTIASGALDATSKRLETAQWLLQEGIVANELEPGAEAELPAAVMGAASGLVVKSTTSALLTIAADEIVLRASDGRALTAYGVSAAVDMAGSSVGGLDTGSEASSTWYYIHVIGDGRARAAGLLSLSATAPTMPAGFNYRALVGAVYNDGSNNFIPFWQAGRRVWQKKQAAYATTGVTSLTSLSLAAYVPATAKSAFGTAGGFGAANGGVLISSDAAGGTFEATVVGANGTTFNGFTSAGAWEVPLLTAQTVWHKEVSTNNHRIEVGGFTL